MDESGQYPHEDSLFGRLSRRRFLELAGGSLLLALPGCGSLLRAESTSRSLAASSLDEFLETFSPIDRTIGAKAPEKFSGDDFTRAHRALWDVPSYLNGRVPVSTESVPVVVIGGGMSGLLSAYLLRDLQPIVLESAPRFGGNSRGESWQGLDYGLGAAYLGKPEPGSAIGKLCAELDVASLCRVRSAEDPIELEGKLFSKFWEGESAPSHRRQFERLHAHLLHRRNDTGGFAYPEIPADTPRRKRAVAELDAFTFAAYLKKVVGGELHPHLRAAIEHYCWSSFGGSSAEISAAAGFNFFAAEGGPIWVAPGGNAAIAERALSRVASVVPRANLRAGALCLRVDPTPEGADVLYEDAEGKLRRLLAKAVVLSCPKLVASKIWPTMEAKRREAVSRLTYRAYVVANVLLKRPAPSDRYDLYLLGAGKSDPNHVKTSADLQQATDVVFGNFSAAGKKSGVLTLYRALPYDGGRGEIFAPESHARFRREFESQITRKILPLTGFAASDIVDIRLTRWGHPLPIAKAGMYNDGTALALHQPYDDRLFFVEQDNWMLPAFETAAAEALRMTPLVRRRLGRSLAGG